jgi:hypothetical protein
VLAYEIDHTHRIVRVKAEALLTAEEMFAYQREVWSRLDVAGYDELIDVSGVERIVGPSPTRIAELADLSARMDSQASPSRLAIVVPDDFAFGLGRMYQAYRATNPSSRKEVAVFRSPVEAVRWLGRNS